MISCTEYIPAYSELFTYLENRYGREEVEKFWEYLFAPDGKGIPLIIFLQKEGIRGCYSYWSGSLNEEAADFTMYLNEARGFFLLDMHRCPSKGRLLELKEQLGIVPYRDYCLHCDHYRAAAEKAGFRYIYNFQGVDRAACSLLIYDPKVFDGRVIIDKNTQIMDRKASENEYFHRDFHSSMNMGIHYLGTNYGMTAVKEYLTQYTQNVYRTLVEAIKESGLAAIEAKIRDTYEKEKAADALQIELAPDGSSLNVRIIYCPAVKHLRATGREVSAWYRYTTEVVMETLAEASKCHFALKDYDEITGASVYSFEKY